MEKFKFPNNWSGNFSYSLQKERIQDKNDQNYTYIIRTESDIYLSNKIDSYHEKLFNEFTISGRHTKYIHVNELKKLSGNFIQYLFVYTPWDKHGIPIEFDEIPKELNKMISNLNEENISYEYYISSKL